MKKNVYIDTNNSKGNLKSVLGIVLFNPKSIVLHVRGPVLGREGGGAFFTTYKKGGGSLSRSLVYQEKEAKTVRYLILFSQADHLRRIIIAYDLDLYFRITC